MQIKQNNGKICNIRIFASSKNGDKSYGKNRIEKFFENSLYCKLLIQSFSSLRAKKPKMSPLTVHKLNYEQFKELNETKKYLMWKNDSKSIECTLC